MSYDSKHVAAALAVGALGAYLVFKKKEEAEAAEDSLAPKENRAKSAGVVARWTKPVVIAPPGLQELGKSLAKRLGSDVYPEEAGPTLCLEKFKSGDPNTKFNWQRVVGRKVVFLFDTVNQDTLFEQLALLQALQGFAVPDGEDKTSKWKTYVNAGKYSWGRASQITVVLPWYRPCQMERTSRWHLDGGKWVNDNPKGEWLDVPTAQYMARLLATPGSVPPLPGPSGSLDGMPIHPLWRPPLELLFVELHEEAPIRHSVSDLGATIRMERFVPYFLDKYKARKEYAGTGLTYVLFPDKGAYDRYHESVINRLKLDCDHIIFIKKQRVGESTAQEQKLYYVQGDHEMQKSSFSAKDNILIVDDFTNSGGTLFGAVNLVNKMTEGGKPNVSIFVSHLVATYDPKVVTSLLEKLHGLGSTCKFYTTNSVPMTTDLMRNDPQVEVTEAAG
eukprot:TRINITY_DN30885_c0_g1_i1.p1 TRINITY_DN30885_c0_g1~~TRINITY_DN30885_c0_g1_i1.p1  ORF type:complete len:446 (-),score=125.12 TRINITY_DN30885_c0_g1_i1:366-1703(-)